MPPVVMAVASFVVANAAITATWALAALTVASVAVGAYQQRKARRRARDAYNASLQDRMVMVPTVDGARSVVLGRARNVDGVLFKATRGSNSEFYTLIVAVAGHEVDAIEDVYFNDQLVTLDGSGYVQTAPWAQTERVNDIVTMALSGGAGSVTLPFTPVSGSVTVFQVGDDGFADLFVPFTVTGTLVTVSGAGPGTSASVAYQYDTTGRSYARVRKYTGSPSQDLSADLVADFPTLCTSADKFRGIALLRVDLEYSQDAYPSGVPNVTAVVRGARCYDPRSNTTAWTQNPAILARHWARHANGGNTTAVDDAAIVAAANVCDVDTAFVAPSGTVTMDTYQAGIVCKLDQDPSAVLGELVEAMAGRWGWSGGVLTLVAGAYRAPVATITEDWVSDASQISLSATVPRSELVNAYRPTIANRDNKYQPEPAPPLIAAAYVAADGEQLDREITMGAVTSPLQAQHICGVLLRDARQSLAIELPCNLRALKLSLFDTVNVTLPRFGWSAKLFEVMGWRLSLTGGVVLTLKEANASVYNPDAGFADLGDDDNSKLPRLTDVPQITGVTVDSTAAALVDGSILTRTRVSWSALADASVTQSGRIEIQYSEAAGATAADWPGQTEAGNATKSVIVGLRAERVVLIRVRAINTAGVRGKWSVLKAHKVGSLQLIETPQIALAAATDSYFGTAPDGSLGVSDDGGGGSFFSNSSDRIADVWTNNTAQLVNVQYEASARGYVTGGSGTKSGQFRLEAWKTSRSTLSFQGVIDIQSTNYDANNLKLFTDVRQVTVAPGETINAALVTRVTASGVGASATLNYFGAILRRTAIKR